NVLRGGGVRRAGDAPGREVVVEGNPRARIPAGVGLCWRVPPITVRAVRNDRMEMRRLGGRTRRAVLRTIAATSIGAACAPLGNRLRAAEPPGRARGTASFDGARRRAAGFERLHSIIVGRGGTIVIGEAFRGAPLDRPVAIKSVSKTIVA